MSTITLTVNAQERTLPADATCRTLVQQITGREVGPDGRPTDGAGLGVAVALDGAVVPRTRWDATPLRDGQAVDVVTAVQGG